MPEDQSQGTFTEHNTVWADESTKNQKLAMDVDYFQLLHNYTKEMETCRVWLKEYCSLKKESESLNYLQYYTMIKLEEYLDCKYPLPQDHYDKILASYTSKLKHILEVLQALQDAVNKDDQNTRKAQEQVIMNLPYENCQFLCTHTEDEESEPDTDLDLILTENAHTLLRNLITNPRWLRLARNDPNNGDDDDDDDNKRTYLA